MATQKGQMVFVEVNIEVRKVKIDNREPINMMHKQMRRMLYCTTRDIFQCLDSTSQDL